MRIYIINIFVFVVTSVRYFCYCLVFFCNIIDKRCKQRVISVLLIFLVFCVVLLCGFTFLVPCCDVCYDIFIKTMWYLLCYSCSKFNDIHEREKNDNLQYYLQVLNISQLYVLISLKLLYYIWSFTKTISFLKFLRLIDNKIIKSMQFSILSLD